MAAIGLEFAWYCLKLENLVRHNLIRLMNEHGIGGSELARLIGVTHSDVSRWIHGKICPRIPTLGIICEKTGWKPHEFLRPIGDEEEQDENSKQAEIAKSVASTVEAAGFERPKLKKKSTKKAN